MTSPPNSGLWLNAEWPVPGRVRAGCTTLHSGFSSPPYTGLNLARHVGDEETTVERNRSLLESELGLPSPPLWLEQIHGDRIIDSDDWFSGVRADACFSRERNVVCAVLSADCLPLLLCNEEGSQVAALHLGWRGICSTLLDQAISSFGAGSGGIRAWIGPHIHSRHYEVGEEVRQACEEAISGTDHAFIYSSRGKWRMSLSALVRQQLLKRGISMIYACNLCTFEEQDKFYSYRRENITGRVASLIWMESNPN